MAEYTRLGSFLVAQTLAAAPAAKIHRAFTTSDGAWERHCLLSVFSDELSLAGLGSRWTEVRKAADQLDGARGFGANYRIETGDPVHLACDYLPGRTLAQILARTREEQVPLGVDHALTVLQSLAQAVVAMHDRHLHHGVLSPHSAWVTYEGATLVLDAPVAAIVKSLLPRTPVLRAALEPGQTQAPVRPFQQDLFALGAILYEMLTLEPLPAGPAIAGALARATLKAAQEEAAVPGEMLAFMKRLLLVDAPFDTAPAFSGALERVLFGGDYSPAVFNMAFLMHTLFRQENEADAEAVRREQGGSFKAHSAPGGTAPGARGPGPDRGSSRSTVYLVAGGVVAAGLFGGMFWQIQQGNRQHQIEQKSLQDKLAALQREKEANDAKLAEIAKQEAAQKTLEEMFGQQAENGGTAEARDAARKELESARLKARDLARQRADALKEKQQLQARQTAAAAWAKAAAPSSAAAFNAAAGTTEPLKP